MLQINILYWDNIEDKTEYKIENDTHSFKFIKYKNTKAIKYMWLLKLKNNKFFLSFSQ